MLYVFEDFVLDTDKRELRRGADVVAVAPQVFDVLDYLIRNRERVVSKDDLVTAIWEGRIISDAALTTRLKAVRSAIGDSGEGQRLIKTLPRKGFRFVGRVQEEQGLGRMLVWGAPAEPPRLKFPLPLSKISLWPQGGRGGFVERVSVYVEILSISSRARSCRSFAIVSIGNVEAVCGTRQVLRTMVESSSRSVRKLWTGVPSSSCLELAFFTAAAERRAGATGSRVALAA